MLIILCGLPMSGKTTTGRQLALRKNLPFIDTDLLIQEAEGMSCRDLFRTKGEKAFRAAEQRAIETIRSAPPCVVSIGGGALTVKENVEILRQVGTIIYLQVSLETILKRMTSVSALLDADNLEESLNRMIEKRTPQYEAVADLQIACDGLQTEEIVTAIISNMCKE